VWKVAIAFASLGKRLRAMFGLWVGENMSVALFNVGLLALWPALPLLIIVFIRQILIARRTRSSFALRKSETAELERAVLLYDKACSRIKEISEREGPPFRLWHALLARPANVTEQEIDELEELEAHAQHLRATIVRLTSRPLRRLRKWVHSRSVLFGSGLGVATHVVTLVLLIVAFYVFEQSIWTSQFATDKERLVWYPLDERLFFANAVAAGFASTAAPLFYLLRRAGLKREYSFEFSIFTDLANSSSAPSIAEPESQKSVNSSSQQADHSFIDIDASWVAILGLSESATIGEVKEAYKVLIKQNHPDRVHDMSPALKTLAELETKKINAAYRQALLSVPSL
jgi:hypothetical protein